MNPRHTVPLLLALLASLSLAQEEQSSAEVFRRVVEHKRRWTDFRERKRELQANVQARRGMAEAARNELQKAYDPKRAAVFERKLGVLACMNIKSPELRAIKMAEAAAEVAAAKKAWRSANAPFVEERTRLALARRPLNEAMARAFLGTFRKPDRLGIATVDVNASVQTRSIHVEWRDSELELLARVRLRFGNT